MPKGPFSYQKRDHYRDHRKGPLCLSNSAGHYTKTVFGVLKVVWTQY